MQKEKYRVAIYVRESRDEGMAAYDTIETQRDLLVKYAAEHVPGNIVGIFEDDNYSGTNFDRPGFAAMEAEMKSGEIDVILLKDLSRLGRSNGKTLVFLEYAESLGVRVLTADGRYDSLSNTETAGIDTWFNERYVADISRKIRASLHFKIQSGKYIGTAPYGYQKDADQPGRLLPDPEKAEYVREIYQLYLDGWGYKKIAEYFTEQSISPPQIARNQSGSWSPQSVRRILTSPVYIGTTVQGVSEKTSYKSKKTRRLLPEHWTVTPDTHPPLVERSVYEKVQALRLSRQNGAANYRGRLSPFKNLVYCGYCGGKMFSRSSNGGKRHGFICSSYVKGGAGACRRNYVDETELKKRILPKVRELVQACVERGDPFSSIFAPIFGTCHRANAKNRMEALYAECEELKRRECIVYEDRLKGVISEALFQRMSAFISQRRTQLEARLQELQKRVCQSNPAPDHLTETQMEQAISCAVSKITVKSGDVFVDYKNCSCTENLVK